MALRSICLAIPGDGNGDGHSDGDGDGENSAGELLGGGEGERA